jgi:RNA recognition motif-containing protein
MTIYVGNLNYRATEEGLQELFSRFGEVTSAKIMTDKMSGRSKGFGFIEMANDDQANAAIEGLNDTDFLERKLVVNQARPRTEGDRPPRRSFNRSGGGGGGGFNRGGSGGGRGGYRS